MVSGGNIGVETTVSDAEHRLAKHYHDLRQFPSVKDAENAVNDGHRQLLRIPSFWLVLLASTLVAAITGVAIFVAIGRWLLLASGMFGLFIYAVTAGLGFSVPIELVATWLWRRRFRRFLRERLIVLGVPVCINCGYNLTGNESGKCPECATLVPKQEATA